MARGSFGEPNPFANINDGSGSFQLGYVGLNAHMMSSVGFTTMYLCAENQKRIDNVLVKSPKKCGKVINGYSYLHPTTAVPGQITTYYHFPWYMNHGFITHSECTPRQSTNTSYNQWTYRCIF